MNQIILRFIRHTFENTTTLHPSFLYNIYVVNHPSNYANLNTSLLFQISLTGVKT